MRGKTKLNNQQNVNLDVQCILNQANIWPMLCIFDHFVVTNKRMYYPMEFMLKILVT